MQGCEILKIVTGLIIVLLIIIVAGHVLGIMRSVADGKSMSDNFGGLLRSGLLLGVSYAFYIMYRNCSDRQEILKYFNLDDVPVETVKKFAKDKYGEHRVESAVAQATEVREAAERVAQSTASVEGEGEDEYEDEYEDVEGMFEPETEGWGDNIMD